jgi:mono/diheme cytochrome c family protein
VIKSRRVGVHDETEVDMAKQGMKIWATLWLAGVTTAQAQGPESVVRGALLYETHCIVCHSSQIHWRANRLAKDWPSLKFQVNRWQKEAALAWNEQDIIDVATYLNAVHYRFPAPQQARAAIQP